MRWEGGVSIYFSVTAAAAEAAFQSLCRYFRDAREFYYHTLLRVFVIVMMGKRKKTKYINRR